MPLIQNKKSCFLDYNVGHAKLGLFLVGVVELSVLVCVSLYIVRQRIKNQLSLVLPAYKFIVFYTIAVGFVSGLFFVTGYYQSSPYLMAAKWFLFRLVSEFVAVFLMHNGVGSRAFRNSALAALSWASLSAFVQVIVYYLPEFSYYFYVSTMIAIISILFLGYLPFWLVAQPSLHRRPALVRYARSFSIVSLFFIVAYITLLVDVDGGACAVDVILALADLMQPIAIINALREDSRFWQGLYLNVATSNLNQPLEGIWDLEENTVSVVTTTISHLEKKVVPIISYGAITLDVSKFFSGGNARVYRGQYGGKEVAVKILFCFELTPDRVVDFCNEATLLNSLQHSHVVECRGVAVMPPAICLVTEFCHHGSLFDFLHKQSNKSSQDNSNVDANSGGDCDVAVAATERSAAASTFTRFSTAFRKSVGATLTQDNSRSKVRNERRHRSAPQQQLQQQRQRSREEWLKDDQASFGSVDSSVGISNPLLDYSASSTPMERLSKDELLPPRVEATRAISSLLMFKSLDSFDGDTSARVGAPSPTLGVSATTWPPAGARAGSAPQPVFGAVDQTAAAENRPQNRAKSPMWDISSNGSPTVGNTGRMGKSANREDLDEDGVAIGVPFMLPNISSPDVQATPAASTSAISSHAAQPGNQRTPFLTSTNTPLQQNLHLKPVPIARISQGHSERKIPIQSPATQTPLSLERVALMKDAFLLDMNSPQTPVQPLTEDDFDGDVTPMKESATGASAVSAAKITPPNPEGASAVSAAKITPPNPNPNFITLKNSCGVAVKNSGTKTETGSGTRKKGTDPYVAALTSVIRNHEQDSYRHEEKEDIHEKNGDFETSLSQQSQTAAAASRQILTKLRPKAAEWEGDKSTDDFDDYVGDEELPPGKSMEKMLPVALLLEQHQMSFGLRVKGAQRVDEPHLHGSRRATMSMALRPGEKSMHVSMSALLLATGGGGSEGGGDDAVGRGALNGSYSGRLSTGTSSSRQQCNPGTGWGSYSDRLSDSHQQVYESSDDQGGSSSSSKSATKKECHGAEVLKIPDSEENKGVDVSKIPIGSRRSTHRSISKSFKLSASGRSGVYSVMDLLTPRLRLQLARDCCAGVAFLHASGFMHCDIKSLNFLVTKDLAVKLADLGEARTWKSVSVTGKAVSKDGLVTGGHGGQAVEEKSVPKNINWSSPETMSGSAAINPSSDVWSLAFVVSEILTGQVPFDAEIYRLMSLEEFLRGIAGGWRPALPEFVDDFPGLRETIEQAWAYDPANRCPAHALLAALEKALSILGVPPPTN